MPDYLLNNNRLTFYILPVNCVIFLVNEKQFLFPNLESILYIFLELSSLLFWQRRRFHHLIPVVDSSAKKITTNEITEQSPWPPQQLPSKRSQKWVLNGPSKIIGLAKFPSIPQISQFRCFEQFYASYSFEFFGKAEKVSEIRFVCFWKLRLNVLAWERLVRALTAPFNNMRTPKLKAQPRKVFFATVNQSFGGSSQLPATAERAVIKSNRWAQFRQHSRKLGGAAKHLIDGSEKRIYQLSFEF